MALLSATARRWAVPGAVVATIAAGVGGSILTADAAPSLPSKSAAELLVDLHAADPAGLSGTVVQNADLGLPALPTPGGRGSAEFGSLLAGTHTLRLWYAGPDKVRVALLGTLGESDVIRNGRDLWTWSSAQNKATHTVLPAGHDLGDDVPATGPVLTPQEAAEQALDAIDPTTSVTTDGTARVAGRAAYELVLAPKDDRSLVGQVRLAIDAETHVPLRVQVMAKGRSEPGFEVGFTHVSFGVQDEQQFRFRPPPGATVTDSGPGKVTGGSADIPETVGSGWTAVLVLDKDALGANARNITAAFGRLERVSGTWGSGRVLTSRLFTALLTDDGRLLLGTVAPEVVYEAAGR